ncbi:predicted protein [Naegleria gruberi]|uniref:Predicted protein n=1 Tax=Naegleria gruberi TaxID=5762 RepID=D2UX88_NAEGR|nr:uncharacterized protein NAEGRDRAFT_61676 [Naegleria gruberi]EFC50884.1 predicted protein [Naegleria gruberi]|eukprot:XP_002683628.1 predicted protein [Naegleria gruberi strain NEG-M]
MASAITKLICKHLVEEETSQKSNLTSPQKGQPNRSLPIGSVVQCIVSASIKFAIQIEREMANTGDKLLYEGTIVNTEDKCIVKLYNNDRDSGFKLWQLRLHYSEMIGYSDLVTKMYINYSDVSYKGTPLEEYIDKNKGVNKTTLMIQLLAQLYFLHEDEVLHNDIKPENIIVYQDYPYFIDFEACKRYARYDQVDEICYDSDKRIIQSSSGTSAYNPPEKERDKNYITPKSDVYSLGLVFAKMLGVALQTKKYIDFELLKKTNDHTICNLIGKMVLHDIKLRPSVQQCLEVLGISKDEFYSYGAPTIDKQIPNITRQEFEELLMSKKRERTELMVESQPEQKKVKSD